MAMRLTGMYSGIDTESIIQELVAVRQTKVDNVKKAQTKLEWKQEAWKELNTKVKSFYNGTLDSLRLQSSFMKKVTKISDDSIAEILTGDTAMNSVQKLKVDKLAQTGYLTGGEIKKYDGTSCTSGTKLTDLGNSEDDRIKAGSKIEITVGGKTTEIEVTDYMTIGNLTDALKSAGVNANFDSKTQRFFIGAKESGEKADFSITATNAEGTSALEKMGILVYDEDTLDKYREYVGMDKDKAIEAEVANRLESYLSQRKSLEETKSAQEAKLEAICKESGMTEEEIGELLEKIDQPGGLKDQIKALEEKESPSDVDKANLDKLKKQLEHVEKYQAAEKELTATQESLGKIGKYINENGEASQDLIVEVTEEITAKVDQAQAVIDAQADGTLKNTSGATKTEGRDAKIYLNGALFESEDNTFEINGLTIKCNAETGDREVTLTTQDDTSGIYDMVKKFIKEYSTLINEMDKLYNADEAKDYEPLTDEEKEALSEKEVEKWEQKIKDSILRKDSTLNSVSSAFKQIMSSGFSVNGKTMFLSDFGIDTLGYFEAADNERYAYHIAGDEDDNVVASKTNKLKNMISTDPDSVMNFFTQLANSLYDKTTSMMASVQNYSSAFTLYEDKRMKSEYDDYTKKIADLEQKLIDYEDKWYAKFSAMETAMAKMQSNSNAVTNMLGGL